MTPLQLYQLSAPLCKEHQLGGGARAGCLVCSLQQLSAALSLIDYLCGPPNEMECSSYDWHCNEDAVVEHVRKLAARLEECKAVLREVGEQLPDYFDSANGLHHRIRFALAE